MHALAIVNEDQQLAAINGICVWLFILPIKYMYRYIIILLMLIIMNSLL